MNTTSHPFPIASRGFAGAYLLTMRPYLLFVSGITGIAGMSFAADVPVLHTGLIVAASFLSYGFGQALTDCFQTDTDAISAPYRPLTQGKVSRTQVLWISLAGLAVCLGVFALLYPLNLLLGMLGALGLATYTFFKRRWWGGPLYNAWIVAVLFYMAFLAANRATDLTLPVALAGTAILFGYANFVLSGYFKDIAADRATGYRTLPVVFGRRTAAWICDCFTAGMLLSGLLVLPAAGPVALLPALLLIAGIASTMMAQVRLHRVKTEAEAHSAIAPVVHGYILFFAGLAATMKPDWSVPLIGFYLLFAATLHMRPARHQI